MTYIKLLTILAGLALLTACAGGVTINNGDNDNNTPAVDCTANPFGTGCTAPTQQEAEAFCGDDTKTTATKPADCAQTIKTACTANVFDLILCTANEYVQQRNNFNSMCINQAGKTKEICDMEALVRTCAANPFMDTCLMDMGAIALRETMCLANIMIDDSCRGDRGIATVFCEANPFNTATACGHGDYDDERQSMCLASITTNPLCMGAQGIATLFCTANPFDPSNACMHGDYADERLAMCVGDITTPRCMQIVTPVCEANNGFNNPVCRGIEKYDEQLRCAGIPACADGVITYADWLEGFDTPLNTAADNDRTETIEFLQGTENGLDIGNVTDFNRTPTVRRLNLESLGGDAKNGVAWFSADNIATSVFFARFYSGILSGTNLGAPLTSADASVSVPWAGKFGWEFYRSVSGIEGSGTTVDSDEDFDLTVDFANSEIRAFVNRSGTDHFLLNAEFDDRGRFDGTINHGAFAGNDKDATPTNVTTGVLTGLIGELGAVGVFISNEADIATTNNAYTGGFVAISPKEVARIEQERLDLIESQVTFTDWIGGFGVSPPPATPTSPATNQFLAGTTTLDPLTSITPLTLTSTIGGVGFFTENGAFYAGLLSNTNLGLPVAITPQVSDADVMATWPGKIRAIQVFDGSGGNDTTTALNLNLTVNLTARTFTGTTVDPNSSSTSITINGLFPATDNGVVTGTVTQRANVLVRNGQLTGIIGQSGVVGAFYSDSDVATEHRYVGGFYAAPTQ